ncbi:MAG: DUF1186 domain-containing protein, partial [Planctomycetaceae bacterium]|nr:DUF1186 domain-containing protein [Planctomycetaceae bacterium]
MPPHEPASAPSPRTPAEILFDLNQDCGPDLEQAVRAAQQRGREIIPQLIQAIDEATDSALQGEVTEGNAHFIALVLLTELRAIEALPAIIRSMTLPEGGSYDLYDDAVTEIFSRTLAALADDRVDLIDSVLSCRTTDLFARWEGATALLMLVRDGSLAKEDVIERLRKHLRQAIADRDSDLATIAATDLATLRAPAARGEIEEALQRNLIDLEITSADDLLKQLAAEELPLADLLGHFHPSGIADAMDELRKWHLFAEEADDDREFEMF